MVAISICIAVAPAAKAAAIKNAGFIQSSIWFSKEPFFAGENIRIYSLIFNSRQEDFRGKAVFYDNNKILGESPFSVLGNGGSETVWIDWIPGAGQHKVSASITEATLSSPGKPAESVIVEDGQTSSLETTVAEAPPPPPPAPQNNPAQINTEAANTQNQTGENYLGKTIAKETPAISNAVKSVVDKIDSIASDIKTRIDEKKSEVAAQIQKEEAAAQNLPGAPATTGALSSQTTAPLQKPLNYLFLAALYFGSAVLNYKIILYPLILFLVYKISKTAIKLAIRKN